MMNKIKNEQIYFDGYCPESILKGKKVEMKLNQDDFWESEETGLQLTVFPPFAAILQWRGEGKFRESTEVASNKYYGLLLAKAQVKHGCEIFPDEEEVFDNFFELEEYIHFIDKSYKEFNEKKFNENDPIFEKQTILLKSITKKQYAELVNLYKKNKKSDDMLSKSFQNFHEKLYELGIIFSFKWMRWYEGDALLKDPHTDYSKLSLLQISMLLTAIFRSDRFDDVSIKQYTENGIIKKMIEQVALRNNLGNE